MDTSGKRKRGPYGKKKFCKPKDRESDDDLENVEFFVEEALTLDIQRESTSSFGFGSVLDTEIVQIYDDSMMEMTANAENSNIETGTTASLDWVHVPETAPDEDLKLINEYADITAYQNEPQDHEDHDLTSILDDLLRPDIETDTEGIVLDSLDEDPELDIRLEEDITNDNLPLYSGATVTVGAVMLLIALFTAKEGMSSDSVQVLLSIIAYCLPTGHRLCTSLHNFRCFFRNLKIPLVYHHYCSDCLVSVLSTTDACPNDTCRLRGKTFKMSYFLEIPVNEQIKSFFLQRGFYNNLQHRFKKNSDHHLYKDIYDGSLYKKLVKNFGPLGSPDNISFFLNTDGAPVFKSSNVAIWPLFLVINELPFKLRMRNENMILAGLWFGKSKPAMGTFLKPLQSIMKKFEDGIAFESPDRGNFICKAYLLGCTADLPARSLLCNSVQYNGAYSCWKCVQKGETAKVGKGHTHVYPFSVASPKGPARTPQTIVEDLKIIIQKQRDGMSTKESMINGIKGPSWLMFFPRFNIVSGIAIDYMHGVLLGVQKLLLRLWFSKELSVKCFSIHKHLCKVDSRLQEIKPTLNITRLPRSIEQDLKYWKASEYRSFLLYYGAPVLFQILDETRFQHYLLLVNAIHILLGNGSLDGDIDRAEEMLINFCRHFSVLYDICYMTLNIHQLLHLADQVRELGPLYTSSCFPYEDKNGCILKMIRGTQNIDSQIVTGVSFVQKLPELKETCIQKDTEAENLYKAIDTPNVLKRGEQIDDGIYILGAAKTIKMSASLFDKLSKCLGYCLLNDQVKSFNRLDIHGSIVYGKEYGRMLKRDNSTIKYENGNETKFGQVKYFIQTVDGSENSVTFAVIQKMECGNFSEKTNILWVQKQDDEELVNIKNIKTLCIYVTFTGAVKDFVCVFPNTFESD